MKSLIALILIACTSSFAMAAGVMSKTSFVRLDQEAREVSLYLPNGTCEIQIVSNMESLYGPAHSSSPVAPALIAALKLSKGKFAYNQEGRLIIDISKTRQGGFGSSIVISAQDGRSLRDVISQIIPNEHGEESILILTLLGNDSKFCSFNTKN